MCVGVESHSSKSKYSVQIKDHTLPLRGNAKLGFNIEQKGSPWHKGKESPLNTWSRVGPIEGRKHCEKPSFPSIGFAEKSGPLWPKSTKSTRRAAARFFTRALSAILSSSV